MREELQNKLYKSFPLLYADKDKDKHESCMYWGIDCGEGWYDILFNLSLKLEQCIEDWIKLYGKENHPRASQVKEKFGGLCFYMSHETEEMEQHIRIAERDSVETCEECGQPGQRTNIGWIKTLCEKCNGKTS